jgi:hypothetical protein
LLDVKSVHLHPSDPIDVVAIDVTDKVNDVGANPGLTGDQIYWDLSMKSYWRGGSSVSSGVPADLPYRGYQIEQRITGSGASEFDSDVTHADNFAAVPLWCLAR